MNKHFFSVVGITIFCLFVLLFSLSCTSGERAVAGKAVGDVCVQDTDCSDQAKVCDSDGRCKIGVGFPCSGADACVSGTTCTAAQLCALDTDNDDIADDGSGDGVSGANPCVGGSITLCDDNCFDIPNADQSDTDADGLGDECDPSTVQLLRDICAPGTVLSFQEWVDEDDAILVLSPGQTFEVEDMVGSLHADHGFDELRSFDENNDEIVDASDTHFSDLLIWKDGVFYSLADHGITGFSLAYQENDDDIFLKVGTFTSRLLQDDQQGLMVEIWPHLEPEELVKTGGFLVIDLDGDGIETRDDGPFSFSCFASQVCGDQVCGAGESLDSCPGDCDTCLGFCDEGVECILIENAPACFASLGGSCGGAVLCANAAQCLEGTCGIVGASCTQDTQCLSLACDGSRCVSATDMFLEQIAPVLENYQQGMASEEITTESMNVLFMQFLQRVVS